MVIASLRKAYDLLLENLVAWINVHMQPVPCEKLPPSECMHDQWTALGVEPELLEIVASEPRLFWEAESETLYISDGVKGDQSVNYTKVLQDRW